MEEDSVVFVFSISSTRRNDVDADFEEEELLLSGFTKYKRIHVKKKITEKVTTEDLIDDLGLLLRLPEPGEAINTLKM